MLDKLVFLLQGKLSALLLGAVVVGGTGTAAVVTATNGYVPLLSPAVHFIQAAPEGETQRMAATATPVLSKLATPNDKPAATETPAATRTPASTSVVSTGATGATSGTMTVEGTLQRYDAAAGTLTMLDQHTGTVVTVMLGASVVVVGAPSSTAGGLAAAVGFQVEVVGIPQPDGALAATTVSVQGAPADGAGASTSAEQPDAQPQQGDTPHATEAPEATETPHATKAPEATETPHATETTTEQATPEATTTPSADNSSSDASSNASPDK